MKRVLVIIIGVFISGSAYSQFEIAAQTAIELPLGQLSKTYNPGVGFLFDYNKGVKFRDIRNSLGLSFGYVNFSPKNDWVDFSDGGTTTSRFKSENFNVLQFIISIRKDYIFYDNFEVFVGTGFGYSKVSYEYSLDTPTIEEDGRINQGRFIGTPKVGCNFILKNSIGIRVEAKYNLIMTLSKDISRPPAGPQVEGNDITHFASVGVGVFYRY
jgi:hypothetical protein